MVKGVDTKYILIFIAIISLSFIVVFNKHDTLDFLKAIMTLNHLGFCLSVMFFTIAILHKLKYNNYGKLKSADFNDFKSILLDLISTVMNPVTLLCSISILKGLFLLKFYGIKYFDFFSSNELFFLAIVGFYFLIKSGLELKTMIVELFFRTSDVTLAKSIVPNNAS